MVWPLIRTFNFSVAFCSPAKSLTFSGLMENPLVGKKLKSQHPSKMHQRFGAEALLANLASSFPSFPLPRIGVPSRTSSPKLEARTSGLSKAEVEGLAPAGRQGKMPPSASRPRTSREWQAVCSARSVWRSEVSLCNPHRCPEGMQATRTAQTIKNQEGREGEGNEGQRDKEREGDAPRRARRARPLYPTHSSASTDTTRRSTLGPRRCFQPSFQAGGLSANQICALETIRPIPSSAKERKLELARVKI